jgi:hypothetical protein
MMPMKVTLSAAGFSNWIPLNTLATPFNVAIGCSCSSNINATYSVDYSFDRPNYPVACKITRVTTTATLALTNHGLTTNDSIIVSGVGDTNLDGTYKVASVPDQNSITYTVSNTGVTASISSKVAIMHVFTHPTIVNQTASADGNIAFPVTAVRLRISSYTAGYVSMYVVQAGVT